MSKESDLIRKTFDKLQAGIYGKQYFLDCFSDALKNYEDVEDNNYFLLFGQSISGKVKHKLSGVVYNIVVYTDSVVVSKII